MSLRVLSPGTFTLVVDAGRPASRGLGVPVGGPADRWPMALGNALVGNPPVAAALEITLTGPTLVAQADVGLGVFGAPFRADRDGESVEPNTTFNLRAGQTLRIGGTPAGCRAYVCVAGGFRTAEVLGSRTGLEPVQAGDVLACDSSRLRGRGLMWETGAWSPSPRGFAGGQEFGVRGEDARGESNRRSDPAGPTPHHPRPHSPRSGGSGEQVGLRVLPGPQADWFADDFYSHTYRVTPASNRMGVRLDGPVLGLPRRELVSEPVAPGAVQVTNDGRPIVLGVDGQTIGGYPKVAHVIAADLDVLGQLRPGDAVRFVRVTEAEAEAAAAGRREALRTWLRLIAVAIG